MAVLTLRPEASPSRNPKTSSSSPSRCRHDWRTCTSRRCRPRIAAALDQLAAAVSANTCRLIELSDAGTMATQYVGGAAEHGGERPSTRR